MAHQSECSYKSCCQPCKVLSDHDARVQVRFDLPKSAPDDKIIKLPFTFDRETSSAMFHSECWNTNLVKPLKRTNNFAGLLVRAADKLAEHWSSESDIANQARTVAQLLRSSKAVVFSGAGISTSAGIGDFRGLFGIWTERDRDASSKDQTIAQKETTQDEEDDIAVEDLRPTLAHEAVKWLVEQDIVKYVITQNYDGLHRLSGIPNEKMSELHGCAFTAYCRNSACSIRGDVLHNFEVMDREAEAYYDEINEYGKTNLPFRRRFEMCKQCSYSHRTTHRCPRCRKPLDDTIINFGDDLRSNQIEPAIEHSEKADVMIVLGSTLMVTPASDLCNGKTQKLVICNRQRTDHDNTAHTRVFGDCDVFMSFLLKELMGDEVFYRWMSKRGSRMEIYNRARHTNT